MTVGIYTPGVSAAGTVRFEPRTTEAINLYVSDINGSDLNDGLTSANPLATLTEAEARIPEIIDTPVFVHIGEHSGAGYEPPEIRPRLLKPNCNMYWWGDGAGQPGETGVVIDLAATAVAITDTTKVTSGTLMAANAFRGYIIRMTSGAAIGQRRTIRDHSTTTIVPVTPFTASPAAGDTFEIVHPSVIIKFPNTVTFAGETPLVTGCGGPKGDTISATASGSVWFIGLLWTGGGTSTGVAIIDSKVVFFGVLCFDTTTLPRIRAYDSQMFAGEEIADLTGTGFSTQAQTDLGMPTGTWLFGTGLSYTASVTRMSLFGNSSFRGFFVGAGFSLSNFASLALSGGNILGTGGAVSPIALVTNSQAAIAGNASTPILIADSISTGCVQCSDNSLVSMSGVIITNAGGPCVYIAFGSTCEAGTSATGTGTTFGVQCQFGGKFFVSGACGLLGAAGSDLSVDSVAGAGLAVAVLAAAGDSITNPLECNVIERNA